MISGQSCNILMLVWILETVCGKVSARTYFFMMSGLTSVAGIKVD